jgi:hypothetical protein
VPKLKRLRNGAPQTGGRGMIDPDYQSPGQV